jgi:protein SCO1/2
VAPPKLVRAPNDAPSIYDLDITLRDTQGTRISLDAARGAPVLVTMFYASCAVACPALIDEVKRTLRDVARDDVRVLLVTFDPARDTPEKLAELARVHRLDERWILAAPDGDGARELAAAIGYRYRALDNGEFYHGATIVLLDGDGRPVAKTEGFNQRSTLVTALR